MEHKLKGESAATRNWKSNSTPREGVIVTVMKDVASVIDSGGGKDESLTENEQTMPTSGYTAKVDFAVLMSTKDAPVPVANCL